MLYVRARANEGTAKGAGESLTKVPAKTASVVSGLPEEAVVGATVDAPEPARTSEQVPPVVSVEPPWFESDWLADLVEGEQRRDE